MSEHREEHLDLCAAYALGSIDEADRRSLEAHLSEGCARCEAALADFSAGVVALASSSEPASPPAELRRRVMQAVAGEAGAGRGVLKLERRPVPPFVWGWAAAAAVLAVMSFLQWTAARRLSDELAALQARLREAEQRLEEERSWAAVLNAPGARVAVLAPTKDGAPELRARAIYDPTTRRAVVVFENLKAPGGSDYELWAIRGGVPASLGVIRTDPAGRAVVRLEDVGEPATLAAFAVSLERAGGSRNPNAPSGPVVMVGAIGG